jgi:hypothetical protein
MGERTAEEGPARGTRLALPLSGRCVAAYLLLTRLEGVRRPAKPRAPYARAIGVAGAEMRAAASSPPASAPPSAAASSGY